MPTGGPTRVPLPRSHPSAFTRLSRPSRATPAAPPDTVSYRGGAKHNHWEGKNSNSKSSTSTSRRNHANTTHTLNINAPYTTRGHARSSGSLLIINVARHVPFPVYSRCQGAVLAITSGAPIRRSREHPGRSTDNGEIVPDAHRHKPATANQRSLQLGA